MERSEASPGRSSSALTVTIYAELPKVAEKFRAPSPSEGSLLVPPRSASRARESFFLYSRAT